MHFCSPELAIAHCILCTTRTAFNSPLCTSPSYIKLLTLCNNPVVDRSARVAYDDDTTIIVAILYIFLIIFIFNGIARAMIISCVPYDQSASSSSASTGRPEAASGHTTIRHTRGPPLSANYLLYLSVSPLESTTPDRYSSRLSMCTVFAARPRTREHSVGQQHRRRRRPILLLLLIAH